MENKLVEKSILVCDYQKSKSKTKIPIRSGVYLFKSKNERVLYVGKALNLRTRIGSYFQNNSNKKNALLRDDSYKISFQETGSEISALLLEAALIKKYQPKYNILHKDDKRYLYIKITIKEEFPKVTTSRREDNKKAIYYGPFPKARVVREVLRALRKIFPFCSQKKISKRACFYSHINLCNPCPSVIANYEKEKYISFKKTYRLNIFRLKNVLEGNYYKVLSSLEKEMNMEAHIENFEKAAYLKNIIKHLEMIMGSQYKIASYIENPNYLFEKRKKEIDDLAAILETYYSKITLRRIECFDVSNLFGKQAVGSMVILQDGMEEKSLYRRFRIKTINRVNDAKMMQEIISRRINHFSDWGKPDLIVVDGGKGQVNSALKACQEKGVKIPVIGIVKRMEQIVIPYTQKSTRFIIKNLSLQRPASQILRRIRDESHRFAIAYHKKIRQKEFNKTLYK